MILWVRRHWKCLSVRQRILIGVTVTLPAVVHVVSVGFPFELTLIAYLFCALILAPLLAYSLNVDRFKVEHLIQERVEQVSDEVSQLREALEQARTNYQLQLEDLESAMRAAFAELGVDPPRTHTVRGVNFDIGTLDFKVGNVRVTRGSWRSRFLSWIRSARWRTWEIVYGRQDDNWREPFGG